MNIRRVIKNALLFAICATASSLASAQTASLKGHVVGETVRQFLAISGDMSAGVEACRNAKDKKSARKLNVDLHFCRQLIGAVDNKGALSIPTGLGLSRQYLEFDGQVDFFDGKLCAIQANLMDPWATVYGDLITRFGPATSKGQETFQNDFGAALYGSVASWSEQNFIVSAREQVMNSEFPPEMNRERAEALARGQSSGKYRMVVVVVADNATIARTQILQGSHKSTLE